MDGGSCCSSLDPNLHGCRRSACRSGAPHDQRAVRQDRHEHQVDLAVVRVGSDHLELILIRVRRDWAGLFRFCTALACSGVKMTQSLVGGARPSVAFGGLTVRRGWSLRSACAAAGSSPKVHRVSVRLSDLPEARGELRRIPWFGGRKHAVVGRECPGCRLGLCRGRRSRGLRGPRTGLGREQRG
jgi:hypothetical protein